MKVIVINDDGTQDTAEDVIMVDVRSRADIEAWLADNHPDLLNYEEDLERYINAVTETLRHSQRMNGTLDNDSFYSLCSATYHTIFFKEYNDGKKVLQGN